MNKEDFEHGHKLWSLLFKEVSKGMKVEDQLKEMYPEVSSLEAIKYGAAWDVKDMYPPYVEYMKSHLRGFPDIALEAFSYMGPNRNMGLHGMPIRGYKDIVDSVLRERVELLLVGVNHE